MKGTMKKKNLIILTSFMLVAAGCESSRHSETSQSNLDRFGTMKEPAGAQSHSSDVNPSSASRNVGQSGVTTNGNSSAIEPADSSDQK